jgi:acyl dehydratase
MEISSSFAGRRSRPHEVEISARRAMNYAAGVGDPNPFYFDDERPEGIIAHPMLPVSLSWHMTVHRDEFWEADDFPPEVAARQVHYSEVLELHRPVRAGETVRVEAEVAAVIPHRAGTIMLVRYEGTSAGEPVFTEHAGAMLRDVKCSDGGAGKDLSGLSERFSTGGAGPKWATTLHIDPLAAHLYDGCGDVFNPIHTSPAFAHAVGLPGPILHGTATLAMAMREIVNREADGDPRRVAAIRAHFTGMVGLDTDIRIEMLGTQEDGDLHHHHFLVWNAEQKRAIRNACVSVRQD